MLLGTHFIFDLVTTGLWIYEYHISEPYNISLTVLVLNLPTYHLNFFEISLPGFETYRMTLMAAYICVLPILLLCC